MKTILSFLIAIFCFSGVNSQITYSGTVDSYAIDLVIEVSLDTVQGAYSYKGSGEPIGLAGKIADGTLLLFEKDRSGKKLASVSFPNFSTKNTAISGIWTNLKSNKNYKVELTKGFEVASDIKAEWKEIELMQIASLENSYFKLHVVKAKGLSPKVVGVSIYERETNALLQKINVDCDYFGLKSVSVDDYNFDGRPDFSILKQSHAGPNTTSLYFIYDPKSKTYIDSGFKGVSLSFDSKTERVTETNQSKAGNSKLVTEYSIVNNKMVVLSSRCFLFDDKAQDFIERPLKECN